jgi:hypothetical protein
MSLADALVTVIDQGNYARVDHHCIISPRSGALQLLTETTTISSRSCSLSHAMPSCHHAEVARGS